MHDASMQNVGLLRIRISMVDPCVYAGALALEEELFGVLIAIYRSPALLFELTRKHKQS